MIRLLGRKHQQWRNQIASRPVLAASLEVEMAEWNAGSLSPGIVQQLRDEFPGLAVEPSWGAARLVAEIAQQIQLMGDVVSPLCGVHAWDEGRRIATVYFACLDQFLGAAALHAAVQLVERLTAPIESSELARLLRKGANVAHAAGMDQSTRAMVFEAERRGIPWFRMGAHSVHVQLGQGARQKRLRETLASGQSAIGREIARNKLLTFEVLSSIGVPVGRFAPVTGIEAALRSAESIGYPVVLKPAVGTKGTSVIVNLRNPDQLRAALSSAKPLPDGYVLQSFFQGDDHRLLVVSGKLVAATRKRPASVTGDARHTIAELVETANRDPRRGTGYTKIMNLIVLDAETDRILADQGYSRKSVPALGQRIDVRATANISTGGTADDVGETVHPDNARAAIRAAKALDVDVAGIDFVSTDISKSWHEAGGGICEVNLLVGLRPHWLAAPDSDVNERVFDFVYPPGDDGRIPTAMITGTLGKTTTTAMLASVLASAGHKVGYATTDAVTIDGEQVGMGDFAGRNGASMILRDPSVTAAVLETARGGLLLSGTYLDRCDVAALLNIRREQIGMDGIETLDEMVALKRKVLEAARRAVILNADDPRCLALLPEFASSTRTLLFSCGQAEGAVREHIRRGGEAVFLGTQDGEPAIVATSGPSARTLMKAGALPCTRGGVVWPNVANAMAAAALALGLDVDHDVIAEGLMRYGREFPAERGRFAFRDEFPVPILFDFAVCAPAIAAATSVVDAIPVSGRRFCVVTMVGNRPDWQYPECAGVLAGRFQRYICFEREDLRRGKRPGEIASRLAAALIDAGTDEQAVSAVDDLKSAAETIAKEADASDFVTVFGSDRRTQLAVFRAAFADIGRTR